MATGREEYRREIGGLLGTVFVGIAINILTAETDTWWGPLRPVARYPYIWVPLCLLGWVVWRFYRHLRSSVVWRGPESPYPGLAPFTEDRASVFFGRERETNEIRNRLERSGIAPQQRVVTVVGPSGVGKSSLLRAGVLPGLPRRWRVVGPLRPAADPFLAVAEAVTTTSEEAGRTARLLRAEAGNDVEPPHLLPRLLGVAGPVLLVVDQLEDIFTLTGAKDREAWWALIARTMQVLPELRLLVAIRPEFRGRLTDLEEGLVVHPVAVGPLDTGRIRQAIDRPARAAGVSFEGDLVDRMVADATVGDALPLLGHLLQRLYREAADRQITVRQYENAGEVGGAIAAHADELYESLSEVFKPEEIDAVLLRGVSVDGSQLARRTILRSSLHEREQRILDEFVAARLVIDVNDGAGLELAHDALFRQWDLLANLVTANEERLRRISRLEHRAAEWTAQPLTDDLLRGDSLADARKLTRSALSDAALAFLDASAAADSEERILRSERVAESAQQLRAHDPELASALLRAAVADLAVSEAAGLTLWSLSAQPERRYLPIGHHDHVTSMVWLPGRTVLRTADKNGRVCTWNGEGELTGSTVLTEMEYSAETLLSRDGAHAITRQSDQIDLWRVADGCHLGSLQARRAADSGASAWGSAGCLAVQARWNWVDIYRIRDEVPQHAAEIKAGHTQAMAWSPAGDRLAIYSTDGLLVFLVGERVEQILRIEASWTLPELAWAADGIRLAVSAGPGLSVRQPLTLGIDTRTLQVYDTDTGDVVDRTPTALDRALAWSPVADVVAFATQRTRDHHRVGLLDVTTRGIIRRRARAHGVDVISWSSDGSRLGLGGTYADAYLWDLEQGRLQRLPIGRIRHLSWAPDSRRAVIGRRGAQMQLASLTEGADLRTLAGDGDQLIAWSPRGDLIASSTQQQISLWNATTGELDRQWGPAPVPRQARAAGGSYRNSTLTWSSDGTRIVTRTHDFWQAVPTKVTVWGVLEQAELAILAGGETSARVIAWSPDMRLIAAADDDNDVVFWSGEDYRPAGRWHTGALQSVGALEWAPDSTRLAAASAGKIEIWSPSEQRVESRCVGHTANVERVCWSPDGSRMASISGRELFIWRVQDGRLLGVLSVPLITLSLAWSDALTVTADNGAVLTWTVPDGVDELPPADDAQRTLTAAERHRYGLPPA